MNIEHALQFVDYANLPAPGLWGAKPVYFKPDPPDTRPNWRIVNVFQFDHTTVTAMNYSPDYNAPYVNGKQPERTSGGSETAHHRVCIVWQHVGPTPQSYDKSSVSEEKAAW